MGQYADRIANLELVQQLKRSVGRDDIPATELTRLEAMVFDVADIAGPLLSRIPQTFRQYTEHDLGHCCNIIYLMGKFIPKNTLERLNGLELAILLLAALLHDFGMFVSEEEKAAALASDEINRFLAIHAERALAIEEARKSGQEHKAALIQDALLAEYFRRLHPERAAIYIRKHLEHKLTFRDKEIVAYVIQVCESHAWGVHESHDPRHPDRAISKLDTNRPVYGVPVNLQYIACCLRLADIMDFDRSRTPLAVFQNIEFTESKSWEEWNKHLQISGWSINEYEVLYVAECTHPAFYVSVMEFLDLIDMELRECRQLLVKEAPRAVADRYLLHLPPIVDRWKIEMVDKQYLAGAFRFQLEYERILQLLMDKSLYPDPSLFLRELLQNSLDACRNREAIAKSKGMEALYSPRIVVWDHSDDVASPRIIFQDNGIGMSRKIIENYFMRVGRSYYRSPEFDIERQRLKAAGIELEACSQFGIGILSCFMVAARFAVETYRVGNQPMHVEINGPTKYFTMRLLDEPARTDFPSRPSSDKEDGPPNHPGTRVTVYLNPGVEIDVAQFMEKFAVNIEYDIFIYHSSASAPIVIPRKRWQQAEIQISDFRDAAGKTNDSRSDRWALPEFSEPQTEVEEGLQHILLPSRIPFENYDFSQDLHGYAWLWFLKGENGEVTPERGYLSLYPQSYQPSSSKLGCTGLPSLMVEMAYSIQRYDADKDWKSFLQILGNDLEADATEFVGSDDYKKLVKVYEQIRGYHGADIIKNFYLLSREERQAGYEFIMAASSPFPPLWYDMPEVVRELLKGGTGWSKEQIDFRKTLYLNALPQSIALHGILLPAGFVKWDPMVGNAKKVSLLPSSGGMHMDARGTLAPVPAASRLFVDSLEAQKAAVPFARAVLRHVCDLAQRNSGQPSWPRWVDAFVRSLRPLYYWPYAVWHELEFLEDFLPYQMVAGDFDEEGNMESREMFRKELNQTYGRWMPIYSYKIKNEGLKIADDLTGTLVSFRPKRKRGDGIWEIDLEGKLTPQGDTLAEVFMNWRAEMGDY